MYAVIKTGGKQYRVAANDKILIEKLEGAAGDPVHFTDVLMVSNGDSIDIGVPLVAGATVVGEIAKQEKSDTVYIFKKRRRKHYRRRNGHRQLLTSVTITEILTGGAKPAAIDRSAKAAKASGAGVSGEDQIAKAGSKASGKSAASDAATLMSAGTALSDDDAKSAKAAAKKSAKSSSNDDDSEASAKKASGKTKKSPVDDLTLIGGIGPKIGAVLNELGYTTFAEVAAWTDADIDKVEDKVGPKGRVQREEWIEQAKELMAGKPPRAKADRERD